MASSSASSSSLSRKQRHQVFPSFCGGDVRRGFLSHIQHQFKKAGIIPFIDNEIERGEFIGSELEQAIKGSKIAIVLLSKNYASSSWCLNELVEIMNCKAEMVLKVMTIFYELEPTDVRKQTGYFGKAFRKTCVGKTKEVKDKWKQALTDVAGIAGYLTSKWSNEVEMIQKIVLDISNELNFTPSRDFDDLVGMNAHIARINELLCLENNDVRMIGIWGPPGIGKTTIVRVLYDQLSPQFDLSTFMENINLRPSGSRRSKELAGGEYKRMLNYQKQLLSGIFNQKDLEIHHLGSVSDRLQQQKVLVVLDGVDRLEQLMAMAKETKWFGPGSRIIITTQDRRLLGAIGVQHIYNVGYPSRCEALEIFCLSAFGQRTPNDGFEQLAEEVAFLAGELPLGLKVMGSYLRGMTTDEWVDALPRLRTSLDGDIEGTLRFSYDVLTDKDKSIFLHISCLFVNYEVESVKRCLADSGLDINHGLKVLVQKSLISTDGGFIHMHSLLPVNSLLISLVTKTVLGMRLDASEIKEELILSKSAFQGMPNLQFLLFHSSPGYVISIQQEGLDYLPNKLRLIRWDFFPMRSLPSNFSTKFLTEIVMRDSEFEKSWDGSQPLPNLKQMDFRQSTKLIQIPDLSSATTLEFLDLSYCSSLAGLPSSLGNATSLQVLDLNCCTRLVDVPSSIGNLHRLFELRMAGCSRLEALPGKIDMRSLIKLDVSHCRRLKSFPEISTNIETLYLTATAIEEVPSSIRLWPRLNELQMSFCFKIKVFPPAPHSLTTLDLSQTGIEEVPPWIENLSRLSDLRMYECKKLKTISANISKLESLEEVNMSRCSPDDESFDATIGWGSGFEHKWILQSSMLSVCLPEKAYSSPISVYMVLNDFQTIPDCITHLSHLCRLILYGCEKLVSLPQLPASLSSLIAENCASLETISGSFGNPEIHLNFTNCYMLNQEAKELILSSVCKHALLPCEELPAYFTHRANDDTLTIDLNQRPLPEFLSFKTCILLEKGFYYREEDDEYTDDYIDDDFYDYEEKDLGYDFGRCYYRCWKVKWVSYRIWGRQNGLVVRYGSNGQLLPAQLETDHLYTSEASFTLNECKDELLGEVNSSELIFEFKVRSGCGGIKGCGVELLNGLQL